MLWSKREKKTDIISLTRWVYVMARLFGYWPFTIEFDRSKRPIVCVTKLDYIWFYLSIIFYTIAIRFALNDLTNHLNQQFTLIEIALNKMTTLNHILVTLLCIILDMANREVLWKIILKFKAFDDEVCAIHFILI